MPGFTKLAVLCNIVASLEVFLFFSRDCQCECEWDGFAVCTHSSLGAIILYVGSPVVARQSDTGDSFRAAWLVFTSVLYIHMIRTLN